MRPEALEPLVPQYEAVGKAFMRVVEQYDDKELRLICDYLEKSSAVSTAEMARIIAENRQT